MFVKRLLRRQKAHTILIGDGITLVVPLLPDTLEIQFASSVPGGDPVTIRVTEVSSTQPKVCIDAPRAVAIRHETSPPLCEPD